MCSKGKCSSSGVLKGKVVLVRKNVLEIVTSVKGLVGTGTNLIASSPQHDITKSVFFELITGADRVGKKTCLESNVSVLRTLGEKEEEFDIHFEWDAKEHEVPAAFSVKNLMNDEFYLVSMTLEYPVPHKCDCDDHIHEKIHFVCNTWIYNSRYYKKKRIFFDNTPYLPRDTPPALQRYRKEELEILRGDGNGKREEWDRVYDYDVYNDLGFLDDDEESDHPILGGSTNYPYPRRLRSGRELIHKPNNGSLYEKPGEEYVPRDEKFSKVKTKEFLAYGNKSLSEKVSPLLLSIYMKLTTNEFNGFEEVLRLYEGGVNLPMSINDGGENVLQFPTPQVIQGSKFAWMTDEEFAREMIAGVNPNVIRLLKKEEFPLRSKLQGCDCHQTITVTKENLEINLGNVTINEAFECKRLFVLDYFDTFMPYLGKINKLDSVKAYATRTFLFLKDDGTLKPLAIELNKPRPRCGIFCMSADTKVVLPATEGVESTIWQLAKAHVIVNDTNYHQLISHWLNTHAVMEPFAIATQRNLSVLHPIYKLLHPHYRDTININALARQSLINAGSIIEQTFLPGPYSMEMSSALYKNWVFSYQSLPEDLIRRGLAVKDHSFPHSLRLVIEDYPYAVDGLEIFDAIKTWVKDYVSLYYLTDMEVENDTELQAWWKEVVEKGHGDLKDKPWWPKLKNVDELIQTCTTIIWIGSALHAAVNFGQYPYGGLILNRPTLSRRFIPEPGTEEYDEMVKNPQEAILRTITPKYQTILDLTVMELLSRHASDELYLGQRENPNYWTSDPDAKDAFDKFGKKLAEIETRISQRNNDPNLKNRTGPAQLPYTVLLPTSEKGLTFRGIPNSVSI